MGKVFLSVSMSLDGFITGPNQTVENPMGDGGELLHEWMFKEEMDPMNAEILKDYFASTGVFLMGRRWFDDGEGPWGKNPPFQVPVFVVTHREREKLVKGKTSFTFITNGLEAALKEAKAAAGNKNVTTGGGNIPRQLIKAGLLDEMLISVVPVLLGSGTPLFDNETIKLTQLEKINLMEAPGVTHIRYRVIK